MFCWCEIFFAVYSDGTLCMDVLQDKWSPCQNVSTILTSIQVSGAAPPCVLLVDSPFVIGLCDEWFGSFWPMFPMGVNNNDSKMLDWGKLNYELCLLRCITKCYAQSLYMYQVEFDCWLLSLSLNVACFGSLCWLTPILPVQPILSQHNYTRATSKPTIGENRVKSLWIWF